MFSFLASKTFFVVALSTIIIVMQSLPTPVVADCTSTCFPDKAVLSNGHLLTATSSCGENAVEQACPASGSCLACNTETDYAAINLLDSDDTTYWASSPSNSETVVNITQSLGDSFIVEEVAVIFNANFIPEKATLYFSSNNGVSWYPVLYYSSDCVADFGMSSSFFPSNPNDPVPYCQDSAMSDNKITFFLLGYNANLESIRNFGTINQIRLSLQRPPSGASFYSAHTWLVSGLCSCNGHAETCSASADSAVGTRSLNALCSFDGDCLSGYCDIFDKVCAVDVREPGVCECQHNTQGDHCETCLPMYNDRAYSFGQPCQECNCHNKATSCTFNQTLYSLSTASPPSGGVCDNCMFNTAGAQCGECAKYYFDDPTDSFDKLSDQVCKACACELDGVVDDGDCSRDISSAGQCNCKENVDSVVNRFCSECKDGFFNLDASNPLGCEACDCTAAGTVIGSTCDKVTGQCVCKDNVEGRQCDTCKQDTYGLNVLFSKGCVDCNCNQGGANLTSCDVVSGQCSCRPNVTGRRCNQCIVGSYTPTSDFDYDTLNNDGCLPCDCGVGAVDNECAAVGGQCECKPGVEGRRCDVCMDGYFGLSETGCQDCGCDPTGSNSTSCDQTTGQCSCKPGVGGLHCDECLPLHYGFGNEGCVVCGCDAENAMDSQCDVLTGQCACSDGAVGRACDGCGSGFFNPGTGCEECLCNATGSVNVDCTSSGQCLCQPNVVGLKCSECESGYFNFDTTGCTACACNGHAATCVSDPSNAASPICDCETGYTGNQCEQCADGFFRDSNSLACVPCACNNHAPLCDKATGECLNCNHNTTSFNCELCADGFYGDATAGTPADCAQCPCPGTATGFSFSPTCVLDSGASTPRCTNCMEGFEGDQCEACADGYFGNPTAGVGCHRCTCNGNIDLAQPNNCDTGPAGTCLNCIYHTTGATCGVCEDGYYGNATDAAAPVVADGIGGLTRGCQACGCDISGSTSTVCEHTTGQCPCQPNVLGQQCDSCALDHYGLSSGNGCAACACDLVGALSSTCDVTSGQCACKAGVAGRQCEICADGFFNFTESGCQACECDPDGSLGITCNAAGTCSCKAGVTGEKCDRCATGTDKTTFPSCTPCGDCYDANIDNVTAAAVTVQDILTETASLTQLGEGDASTAAQILQVESSLERYTEQSDITLQALDKDGTAAELDLVLADLQNAEGQYAVLSSSIVTLEIQIDASLEQGAQLEQAIEQLRVASATEEHNSCPPAMNATAALDRSSTGDSFSVWGTGFGRVDYEPGYQENELRLRFRTYASDGLLLFSGADADNFVLLALEDGQLVFAFQGADSVLFRVSTAMAPPLAGFNDGRWHSVLAVRNASQTFLMVDNEQRYDAERLALDSNNQPVRVLTNGEVFVGGADPSSAAAAALFKVSAGMAAYFSGCVAGVEVDGLFFSNDLYSVLLNTLGCAAEVPCASYPLAIPETTLEAITSLAEAIQSLSDDDVQQEKSNQLTTALSFQLQMSSIQSTLAVIGNITHSSSLLSTLSATSSTLDVYGSQIQTAASVAAGISSASMLQAQEQARLSLAVASLSNLTQRHDLWTAEQSHIQTAYSVGVVALVSARSLAAESESRLAVAQGMQSQAQASFDALQSVLAAAAAAAEDVSMTTAQSVSPLTNYSVQAVVDAISQVQQSVQNSLALDTDSLLSQASSHVATAQNQLSIAEGLSSSWADIFQQVNATEPTRLADISAAITDSLSYISQRSQSVATNLAMVGDRLNILAAAEVNYDDKVDTVVRMTDLLQNTINPQLQQQQQAVAAIVAQRAELEQVMTESSNLEVSLDAQLSTQTSVAVNMEAAFQAIVSRQTAQESRAASLVASFQNARTSLNDLAQQLLEVEDAKSGLESRISAAESTLNTVRSECIPPALSGL